MSELRKATEGRGGRPVTGRRPGIARIGIRLSMNDQDRKREDKRKGKVQTRSKGALAPLLCRLNSR